MIIGISGKIGSGKDLIGQIIQYLYDYNNSHYTHPITEEDFKSYLKNDHNLKSSWQIKKFADKLKDIVCLLIGCTREQLEDREFKETPLSSEWDKYLLEEYWINDEYAEHITKMYFNSKEEMEKYCIEMNHTDSTCRQVSTIQKMTPRLLLQILGTQCGRDIIHPNIWVNALMSDYKETGSCSHWTDEGVNSKPVYRMPNWIITDVRFPNETQAIKDRGGINIRVNRNSALNSGTHESETALDDYEEFNYIIQNNSSIEDLIVKVKEILIKENIING